MRHRTFVLPRLLLTAFAFLAAGLTVEGLNGRQESASAETDRYIARLDLKRFERRGSDFTNAELSPFRILPALTERDRTFHYDFDRLADAERKLRGVDRHRALIAIFHRVTAGSRNDCERHLAVLKFLHRSSFHNLIQPMRPNGQPVTDPLVLLELGEMRCGQVNRIACDLFAAAGYRTRLVQAAFHVLAEIEYDGAWHYFDGDIFGNGECVRLDDGHIPSMQELAHCAERLDALISFWEPDHTNAMRRAGTRYPSWFYFDADAYRASNVKPARIAKIATREQEAASADYGWEHHQTRPDSERILHSGRRMNLTAKPPMIVEIGFTETDAGPQIRLNWEHDSNASLYRVLVGTRSRGWNYDGCSLPEELRDWKSRNGPWRPEMYDARYRIPPHDLALIEVGEPCVSLIAPAQSPIFVSVMGIDTYGAAAGRRLFPVSEELCFPAASDRE